MLKADALLYGTVTHYDRLYAVVYAQVAVGAKVRLMEARSGKVLWEREEVVRFHGGSVPTSPWGLAFTAASTALNLRDVEFLHAADDLARKIFRDLPALPVSQARRPPRLDRVLSDAAGKRLKASEGLTVILEGEPGQVGAFDVIPLAQSVPMAESPDGVYTGRFTVRPGDNAPDAYVVARLVDSQGRVSEHQEILGRFTVDTLPPAQPSGLAASAGNGEVHLRWQPNAEPDLTAYRVYRSLTPLTGFTALATVEEPRYRDAPVENLRTYYYRVKAVDQASNESPWAEAVAATPVPPGPTEVSGTIAADAVWHAGSSPYVIGEGVVVLPGATLTIEAGTEVRSRGGGLTVRGRLLAEGEPERKISFVADRPARPWGGILVESAENSGSELHHCEVRGAGVGIRVSSGAVKIAACRLVENATGMAISGETSKVTIRDSAVERNLGDGIAIRDRAAAAIEASVIVGNGQDGLRIEKASPQVNGNRIEGNGQDGMSVVEGLPLLRQNRIEGNGRVQVMSQLPAGSFVDASENYWGTAEPGAILDSGLGRVEVSTALDAPPPEGKLFALPVLISPLSGRLARDGYLVPWRSPYLVQGPVTLEAGATLRIQPGVLLHFPPRSAGFVVKDGAIVAKGTPDRPIVFTSASQAPAPGDYPFAVQFTEGTSRSSIFEHARFEYAATSLRVGSGTVEVTNSEIRNNLQSGVEVSNSGALKISRSQIQGHRHGAALTVMGFGRLTMRQSTVISNAWAVINYSRATRWTRGRTGGGTPRPTMPSSSAMWTDATR